MKAMIRPMRAWRVLIGRLELAVPDSDRYFVARMAESINKGIEPTAEEADRLERLDQTYGAAQ